MPTCGTRPTFASLRPPPCPPPPPAGEGSEVDGGMGEHAFGQPLTRLEDPALLVGAGRFTDDLRFDNETHAVVLRSPHAHARIRGIDTRAATAMPGVLAVLTAADVAVDGPAPVFSELALPRFPKTAPEPGPVFKPAFPVLADGVVRYVGEAVAMVVAETEAQARDAADAIAIDYEMLPAVIDMTKAVNGAPAIW